VYRCLYGKYQDNSYHPETSYTDFTQSHPMFFWRHPTGDLIEFVLNDIMPESAKGKPVIYLYPTVPTKVSVNVSPIGGFTKTDPAYNNGWLVDAQPNGTLTNVSDGKQYPYLFWEGGKKGIVTTPSQGFVVAQKDIPQLLSQKLALFGLNQNEQKDFLAFWVPKLSKAPYYFITFISRSEIDRVSPMTITPKPDTVIRVLMDYKPLTAPMSVEPLQITSTDRKGFTVVEWGGILRD